MRNRGSNPRMTVYGLNLRDAARGLSDNIWHDS